MKTSLIPILSSVALAIMAGAAASHFHSVTQLASFAKMTQSGELQTPSSAATMLAATASPQDTRSLIATLERQNRSLEQSLASKQSALSSNRPGSAALSSTLANADDAELKHFLSELVAQNRDLHNQMAETNRDLMEVQFRFDTLSDKFRPLKLTEDVSQPDPYDTSIGVLPPLDIP